ncbi:hypothetical protein SAMN04487935_3437 [Flavobacterium noncentrifugens]|uniref:PH domain-containing protein n=2 Tax=Flavobacterium noncentrifugens TaxID=1128970 RepID=A0A1G9C1E9_9FLAO|nr:hypothetical protein SAMN04487935_3437 [Flavobacterium noncentrifugens]
MHTKKPLFETEIRKPQYLHSLSRSLIVLLPGAFLIYVSRANFIIFSTLIFIFIFLTIFIILRGLKTFHLYEDLLEVRRPYLKSEIFVVNNIEKIVFTFTDNRRPTPLIRIISSNSENEFALFYKGKILVAFIQSLKKLGIKIENQLNNYYR